jgi:stage V sporulation protein G
MEISNINVKVINGRKTLRAVASFVIDGVFKITDVKILQKISDQTLYVVYPGEEIKYKDGQRKRKFSSIAFPIREDIRVKLEESILAEYEKVVSE